MFNREEVLFYIIVPEVFSPGFEGMSSPYAGRRSPIYYWKDYGITCPDYITSNGIANLVAMKVSHLVTSLGYLIDTEGTSSEKLFHKDFN